MNNKSAQFAKFEIGWWKAHHRKQKDEFIKNMTNLYTLQYNLEPEKARSAVLLRVEAADMHDIAEDTEDEGNQSKADIYWEKAEQALVEHFKILEN